MVAKQFVKKLLVKNDVIRLNASQALAHSYIARDKHRLTKLYNETVLSEWTTFDTDQFYEEDLKCVEVEDHLLAPELRKRHWTPQDDQRQSEKLKKRKLVPE
jgi:hypothetical protein